MRYKKDCALEIVFSQVHVILMDKIFFCTLCVGHSHMMYLWNYFAF